MNHQRSPQSQSQRARHTGFLPRHPPQRVPITSSIMYGYAAMRGNMDKCTDILEREDPLHSSLYWNPISHVNPHFEMPINLPLWQRQNDPTQVQELPLGSVFYHDISAPAYSSPPPRITERTDDQGRNDATYEQSKLHMLPDHLPNHDTGDDGYGHYGYVKANGCWVDPDDQNARKAAAGGLGASYVPDLPIGINPIPPPAEDELYAGFVNEVTDGLDGDGEWDPRATYITPATFARWAAGASQGDKYVRGKVDTESPQSWKRQQLRRCNHTRLQKPSYRTLPQFDVENCSAFSGEYSLHSTPSLALSALGVNMNSLPRNFSYMNPQLANELERAAFGEPRERDPNQRVSTSISSPSTCSDPIINLSEEAAYEDLASSEGRETGLKRWKEYKDSFARLEQEHTGNLIDTTLKQIQRDEIGFEKYRLYKEAYFLKERIRKREIEMGYILPSPRPSLYEVTSRPKPRNHYQPQPRDDSFPTPTRQPRRPKHDAQPSRAMRAARNSMLRHSQARSQLPLREQFAAQGRPTNTSDFPLGPSVSQPLSGNPTCPQIPHSTSQPLACQSHAQAPQAGANSKYSPSYQYDRRRRYLERYLREKREKYIININKTKAMYEDNVATIGHLTQAVSELTTVHQNYRNILGVDDASEIPDLIPKSKKRPRALDPPSDGEEADNEEADGEDDDEEEE